MPPKCPTPRKSERTVMHRPTRKQTRNMDSMSAYSSENDDATRITISIIRLCASRGSCPFDWLDTQSSPRRCVPGVRSIGVILTPRDGEGYGCRHGTMKERNSMTIPSEPAPQGTPPPLYGLSVGRVMVLT